MKVIGPINLYTISCEKLNIKIVSNNKQNSLLKSWCFNGVCAKLWKITFKENLYMVVPIFHSYSITLEIIVL